MKYLKLIKKNVYFAILVILLFSVLGSVLGARKESTLPTYVYGQIKTNETENAIIEESKEASKPLLGSILPLAADQNHWYNFKYAFCFAVTGALAYLILMAIYLKLFDFKLFVLLRRSINQPANKEE